MLEVVELGIFISYFCILVEAAELEIFFSTSFGLLPEAAELGAFISSIFGFLTEEADPTGLGCI